MEIKIEKVTLGRWLYCQYMAILEELTDFRIEVELPASVEILNIDQVHIGEGSKIKPYSYIEGPVVIEENCTIGPHAFIRPCSIIGKGSIIGHCTEIKNSFLGEKVHASHFNYIGDSIIGDRVNFGAGSKCANFRLDEKNISIRVEEQKMDLGINKFGALVGSDVSVGANVVLNPGTVITAGSKIFPLTNIIGYKC